MKKKTRKITAVLLSLLLLIVSLPMNIFAASGQTHNYSDINELDSKYSYGTVFWSDKSELVLTSANTASKHLASSPSNHYIDAKYGEVIEAKLTNCAVDENGNICDVILRVDNIKPFAEKNQNSYDALAERHNDVSTDKAEFLRADLNVKKYIDSDLMLIWFRTNSSSADFTMKYVLSGTDKPADILGTVATIYDIDIQKEDKVGEIWNGNEGFTVAGSDAEVYYLKNNWLIDTPDDKGVRCPDYAAGEKNFEDTNSLIPQNSAVVAESFDDATFRLFYSGYSCGIAYSFASPYPFTVNNPVKTVDKSEAYEGDSLEYTVSQYIPNSYYSSKLNFIENIESWNSLEIKDKFDDCLSIHPDMVTISNELGADASEYFNISVGSDNIVTAAAKESALASVDFYSHIYSLKIKAVIKNGTGMSKDIVSNNAVTQINQTEYKSNSVTTDLIFRIDTSIVNGTITQSISNIKFGENKTIEFKPDRDYCVSSITVDGKSIDPAPYKNGGVYSFSNINADHSVHVSCTPYEWYNINIIYVDEDDNALADPFNQSVRAETDYNVTAEANQDIQYYTLESIEGITEGIVSNNINIIVHYVRNTNNLTINYIDKSNEEKLKDSVCKVYQQGISYDVTDEVNRVIEYYTLSDIDCETIGIINEDIVINCYYTRNQNTLTINYIDKEIGEQLSDSFIQTLPQGTEYALSEQANKAIEHYTFDSIDSDTSGLLIEDTTINVYYVKNSGKVIVQYVDTEGNELTESEILEGKVQKEYTTQSKSINGYELIGTPNNKAGVFTEDDITVIYVYEKIKQPQQSTTVKPKEPTTQKSEPEITTTEEAETTTKEIKETKSPNTGNDSLNYHSYELLAVILLALFSCVIIVSVSKSGRRKDDSNG